MSLLFRGRPASTHFPYTTLFRSRYVGGRVPVPSFALSNPDADQIERLASLGKPVRVRLFSSASYVQDAREEPHARSEEHTSELQSRVDLVCRLLLEKKKKEMETQDQHAHNYHEQQEARDHDYRTPPQCRSESVHCVRSKLRQ